MRSNGYEIFPIAQHDPADANLAALLQRFAEQGVGLARNHAVGPGKVRRFVEHRVDLRSVHKPLYLDHLGALEPYLFQVLGLEDNVLVRLILIAFYDLLVAQHLVALFASLVVPDRAVAFLVQLVEMDRLSGIDGVVDFDGDGHQRKLNVAFPDGSHRSTSAMPAI